MTYRKSMSDAIREVQESTIKPYVSMSMGGQYNVLDKNSKVVYSTKDQRLAYDYFKKNFDKLKEDGDHEVSMAIGQLKTISQYAEKLQTILQSKGNDYDIEAWVQSKITSAEDYMNSIGHYMENDPSVNEELLEVSDVLKLAVLKRKIKQYKDKVFKKTMSTIKSPLFANYEEIEEGKMKDIYNMDQEGKSAADIAKLMKLPLKTIKDILGEEVFEQIAEFTSDMIKRLQKTYATMPQKISPEQAKALSKHLDRLDLASLKQLTKAKIPFVTTLARNKVYKATGKFEEVELEEKTYGETLVSKAKDLAKKFKDNMSKAVAEIEKLEIGLSKNSSVEQELRKYNEAVEVPAGSHKMPDGTIMKDTEHKKDDTKDDKENVAKENADKEIASLKDQIAMLKTKLENEKNKAVKPEPNPKTGEVPLTVGIAHKYFKDKEAKEDVKEAMSDKDKRIQKAKDMIKYYDAQKKAALKGKNKDLAKKMLKNDIEETVSIKAYKNAVDPTKKGLMISKSGGMSGTIMIKDKKELEDLETKIAQAKKMYNIKEMAKDDAYAIGMAQAKKSMNDEPPLDKKTITKGHEIAKSIIKKEETLDEFTSNMIKRLQISYADLKGKTLSPEKATALSKHLDRLDTTSLRQLVKANIPFMSTLARNKIYKKTGKFEERRLYVESISGLQNKAEKSGMPYSILKKVYDRGMAAWKSGHRPGASQQQWAFARVNSFVTKSSGTWGGADKDLAKQVKG